MLPQAHVYAGLQFRWDSEAATVVFIWTSISIFFCLFHSSLLACLKNWIFNATHITVHVCVCVCLYMDRMGWEPSREIMVHMTFHRAVLVNIWEWEM